VQLPGRGPPAYNATPSADNVMVDGVGPVHMAVDETPAVSIRKPEWPLSSVAVQHDVNGPVSPSRTEFHGPVAHRHMDGAVAPSNGLVAHRGLVTGLYSCHLQMLQKVRGGRGLLCRPVKNPQTKLCELVKGFMMLV